MSLNRRNAGVVAGFASALALCIASSMMSPRSVVASETVSSRDGAARSPTASGEIARIHAHFDSVLRELDARPTAQLSPAQRKARLSLVSTLRGYNARGVFPRNYDYADAPTPYFVDRTTGTLCAVAFLLESTGRRDVVDRVARTDNNVWVAQLSPDSAFTSWLDTHGLTLDEAARIQVPYAMSPASQKSEMALAIAAPLSMIASASTGVWNAWGNADGHNRIGSIVGISAGVLAAAFNTRFAVGTDYNRAARGVATAGVAVGGLGIALSTRALMRHSRYLASEHESERARQRKRAEPETSLAPILPIGRNGGAGLAVSVRF